jgi:hypothetical protein
MKPGIASLLLLPIVGAAAAITVALPRRALAAESPRDRETDHLDAFDDGGPRGFGLLVNPAGVLLGVFGVEADVLLTDLAAVTAEGDWVSLGSTTAFGATLGVALFPQQVPFHGLYFHPQLSLMRASDGDAGASLLGGGATVGWEWTLRVGLTLRIGGGAMFSHVIASEGAGSFALDGLRPMADGSVGWVF